jgi:hypothetical protein
MMRSSDDEPKSLQPSAGSMVPDIKNIGFVSVASDFGEGYRNHPRELSERSYRLLDAVQQHLVEMRRRRDTHRAFHSGDFGDLDHVVRLSNMFFEAISAVTILARPHDEEEAEKIRILATHARNGMEAIGAAEAEEGYIYRWWWNHGDLEDVDLRQHRYGP